MRSSASHQRASSPVWALSGFVATAIVVALMVGLTIGRSGPGSVPLSAPILLVGATESSVAGDQGSLVGRGDSPPTAPAPAAVVERMVQCDIVAYTPPTAVAPQVAELCVPADPGPTAVVLVHGGGETGGSPEDTSVWAGEYHRVGVPTLAVEYELFDEDSGEPLWPRPEQHVKAGVQYLRTLEQIEVDRVVIHGWSAGARLAAVAWTTGGQESLQGTETWTGVDDAVDGAVLFYGYYDGSTFTGPGYFGAAADELARPVGQAEQASGPGLLVHGMGDFLVPHQHSQELSRELAAGGVDHELILVPDEISHGFDGYGRDALSNAGRALVDDVIELVDSVGGS